MPRKQGVKRARSSNKSNESGEPQPKKSRTSTKKNVNKDDGIPDLRNPVRWNSNPTARSKGTLNNTPQRTKSATGRSKPKKSGTTAATTQYNKIFLDSHYVDSARRATETEKSHLVNDIAQFYNQTIVEGYSTADEYLKYYLTRTFNTLRRQLEDKAIGHENQLKQPCSTICSILETMMKLDNDLCCEIETYFNDVNVQLESEKIGDATPKNRYPDVMYYKDRPIDTANQEYRAPAGRCVLSVELKPPNDIMALFNKYNMKNMAPTLVGNIKKKYFNPRTNLKNRESYNEYPDRVVGQLFAYPLWSGAYPYTLVTDGNTAIVVKINVKDISKKVNIEQRCHVDLIFFPIMQLTNIDYFNKYICEKYEKSKYRESYIFSEENEVKHVKTPLLAIIGTLIQLNESYFKQLENNKEFEINKDNEAFFLRKHAIDRSKSNTIGITKPKTKSKKKGTMRNTKTKRKTKTNWKKNGKKKKDSKSNANKQTTKKTKSSKKQNSKNSQKTKQRLLYFNTISEYMNHETRSEINLVENDLSNKFDYVQRNDNMRHHLIGKIFCISIKEMNNQLYWFKSGFNAKSIEKEFETMNQLKQLSFPYLVSDYTYYFDESSNVAWLITKHEGISLLKLIDENKINQSERKKIINKVEKAFQQINHVYTHPDFYDRNIIYDVKTKKISVIDFEPLS